jgi:hypothetical protein
LTEEQMKAECDRILALPDKEILAEHLAVYEGDEKLAAKAIDILKAKITTALARSWKQ